MNLFYVQEISDVSFDRSQFGERGINHMLLLGSHIQ